MKKNVNIELCVDDAIQILVEAGGLMSEHYAQLEDKCGLRSFTNHPLTIDDAIQVIYDKFAEGVMLSEDQAKDICMTLDGNPMTLAMLAMHTWKEKDTVEYLREQFSNRGFTSKEDLKRNICDFIDQNA